MSKRLFIAIKPGHESQNAINNFQLELKKELPYRGIRWVKPELMHLTLLFLGDVEESRIPEIKVSLKNIANEIKPYDLLFNGTGFFGRPDALRTIWIGSQDQGETQTLYHAICRNLQSLIRIGNKQLSPHLTLARISDFVPKEERIIISQKMGTHTETVFGSTSVNKFELIESTLTPAGPIYKALENFFLR